MYFCRGGLIWPLRAGANGQFWADDQKMVLDLINSISSSEKVGTFELFESHYKSGHPITGTYVGLNYHFTY